MKTFYCALIVARHCLAEAWGWAGGDITYDATGALTDIASTAFSVQMKSSTQTVAEWRSTSIVMQV